MVGGYEQTDWPGLQRQSVAIAVAWAGTKNRTFDQIFWCQKIAELRAEPGWWVEPSKFLVGDESYKCDPAALPPGFVDSYAHEPLLWLGLMNGRGAGSSGWVESPAKERWGLIFADSDPWHDTQWQDYRARLEDQMDTGLVPRTRAWARAFAFGETTDDVLQFYYDSSE